MGPVPVAGAALSNATVGLWATRLPPLKDCAAVNAGFFSACSSSIFFLARAIAITFATGVIVRAAESKGKLCYEGTNEMESL